MDRGKVLLRCPTDAVVGQRHLAGGPVSMSIHHMDDTHAPSQPEGPGAAGGVDNRLGVIWLDSFPLADLRLDHDAI